MNSAPSTFNMSSIQVRAIAVIIYQGSVLLHRISGDEFWTLPGGRVEIGEDGASTVQRELAEELGEKVIVKDLTFIAENFFTYKGQQYHELGLYFRTEMAPMSEKLLEKDIFSGIETSKKLEFCWFSQAQVPMMDIRPSFLRKSLNLAEPPFQHVVQRDRPF